MKKYFNPEFNFKETEKRVGYTPRKETVRESYDSLGLICGLEVHQQLKTKKKLFCHCPAGIYQKHGEYEAEVIRHMRPTLSEMGGYDGTALMEFKTKKTVIYRIANKTTCTYDVDDTPPFKINPEALEIALEIALLLKTNIVGELHITRKQYLDGSIPTGFQRTGIISIEGQIPLRNKRIGIIQLSIEEDSCREVSDVGHTRIYTTDRLGMPLIETVTYPDMKTPDEAAEAAQYIRYLSRSTGKVRTGIGAAREDVNVSIKGGTRVEIKGVSHIAHIPELVHNEAFRQKSLLEIRSELNKRMLAFNNWSIHHTIIESSYLGNLSDSISEAIKKGDSLIAVNLPGFKGILSFFTQPLRVFADEISDRLKVIACIEKPNMTHSEEWRPGIKNINFEAIRKLLGASNEDAQILFWCPRDDISTALETIEERCKLTFLGVPNETRKALENGITIFERVLPGADRMYPDTDSAPISISQSLIDKIKNKLPQEVSFRIIQLEGWSIPRDTHSYLLRNNLIPLIERITEDFKIDPKYVATLLAHRLKHLEGKLKPATEFNYERIYELFTFLNKENLDPQIAYKMLPLVYQYPRMDMLSILNSVNFKRLDRNSIIALIPFLKEKFSQINTSKNSMAEHKWLMKELRNTAMGNIPLTELSSLVKKGGLRV